MRVAVDAMGGDHGPDVVVAGTLAALTDPAITVTIVALSAHVEPIGAMVPENLRSRVDILAAQDEIGMGESAAQAVRKKPNASINVALRELKAGRADAMVSAGHSGAVLAAALATLGRIPGIDRPALATVLPTVGVQTIMLDLGAITDPKPGYLVQYAHMAAIYARLVLGSEAPKVALLSNGEEPSKGNQLSQEVYALLSAEPGLNFVGNVEGKELLRGTVDIIVTDGFTGNIALKSLEGTVAVLTEILRTEVTRTLPRKVLALAMRSAFRDVRLKLDYAEIGGAPLLGVNGPVIVAHGRSRERAIENAVKVADRTAAQAVPAAIQAAISQSAAPG